MAKMKAHHKRLAKILQKCYDDLQAEWDDMESEEYEDTLCDGIITPLQGQIGDTIQEIEDWEG